MTDRLRTAPLDTAHLVFIGGDHPDKSMVPRAVKELYEEGYPVDVVKRHSVVNDKVDDDSKAYLVTEVETTCVPLEDAVVVEDSMTLFACSCWDYTARRAPFAKENDGPLDAGRCKHASRVAKRRKVTRGEGQTGLEGYAGP